MKQQTPFDTTELEREIEILRRQRETKERNILISLTSQTKITTERLKSEVEKIIDEAKQTSGFVGIGEWIDDRDLDLFFEFIEKLKQKLGLSQEKK